MRMSSEEEQASDKETEEHNPDEDVEEQYSDKDTPNSDEDEEEQDNKCTDGKSKKLSKPGTHIISDAELKKTGIIYLSRIPTHMNKASLRRYFENFGEVGRIWLEKDPKKPQRGKRIIFAEGWIEFKKKQIAKRVAQCLNNTQVGGKKRYAWSEEIWNIKYLNRFKWVHLHERILYERAVHKQRMRTEISQAKRETNFYIENAERSERFRRKQKKREEGEGTSEGTQDEENERIYEFRLKETEEELVGKKRKLSSEVESKSRKSRRGRQGGSDQSTSNKSFLLKIFGGSQKS